MPEVIVIKNRGRGRPKGSKNKPKSVIISKLAPDEKDLTKSVEYDKIEFEVGELVQFYDEGWRVGYVEKIYPRKNVVDIEPVAAYKAKPGRSVTKALVDVYKIEHKIRQGRK